MFRDWEIRYLAASVVLVWTFIIAAAVYEIGYNSSDTPQETLIAVIQWVGPAIGSTLIILATREVILVLAQRYRARRDQEVREKALAEGRDRERSRWKAWNQRREDALRNNRTFNEPNPAEEDAGQ